MYFVYTFMLVAAMVVLFFCGYYVAEIKEKYGKNLLMLVPITIAMFMFHLIWALLEMSKSGRWY
ncbi:hypothetical protein C0971_09775 [Bacillus methanolicus]|uniref:hypothetical protein n=1 Tax=Bacillus methanolicus TaxID=1471 RepID=UPI00200EE66C|nr:hypothetical protein [Bacillus methanolicus]UQD52268.1 hypothetical protein C0971_09775 [Bacillus methanolicus]